MSFIEKELIPFVESNYRANDYRILEGHSLGGLFAASAFMDNPDLFDGYIVMSPSFWWKGQELTKEVPKFLEVHPELTNSLFFGVGVDEGGMTVLLKNYVDALEKKLPENLRYQRKEFEGEGHMSSVLLSTYHGLKFIFSDMLFPKSLYENYSDKVFLDHEQFIMNKYGQSAKQSAESYLNLAFALNDQERYSETITVLKRSVEAYSFDVGLMNFLAQTYEKNKDVDSAIATYKKAIETSKKYNYNREEEFENQIKRLVEIKNNSMQS